MFRTILVVFTLIASTLRGAIYETDQFEQILDYLQPGTLVLLDVDNTMIEPAQTLGSDQWFYYQWDQYVKQGMTNADALEKALGELYAIQNVTKVRLIEKNIPAIIKELQDLNYKVMGLTTRGLGLSTCTVHQLARVNIDLRIAAPTKEEVFILNPRGVLFVGGTLFTAGTDKGTAFVKFLNAIDYKPQRVLFINDRRAHLEEVERSCQALGITFVGLRYGYTDEKVKNFNPEIADYEFRHFGKIISDEEAVEQLKALASN